VDAVLDETTTTQEELYVQSGAQQAVQHNLFQGLNCTILAYGQTVSGKTYSMGTASTSSVVRSANHHHHHPPTSLVEDDDDENPNEKGKDMSAALHQDASSSLLLSSAGLSPQACHDLLTLSLRLSRISFKLLNLNILVSLHSRSGI
jgi:hypothetical protein